MLSPRAQLPAHAAQLAQNARWPWSGRQVVSRRIDIRADRAGWCAGALAHELMHVVMAEECAACELPVWADEGMALMADPAAKRELHLRDLRCAYKTNTICPLAQFLSTTSYPCRQNIAVFYGQSLSLVQFLVDRKSAPEFLSFLRLAGQAGYDSALKTCYGIDGVADLERQWRKSLPAPQAARSLLKQRADGHTQMCERASRALELAIPTCSGKAVRLLQNGMMRITRVAIETAFSEEISPREGASEAS